MSKIYLEILDKNRQKIFKSLSQFRDFGYLGGGTALALQILHRDIDNNLRVKVKNIFADIRVDVDTQDQMTFRTTSQVSITFLWYYFDNLYPLVKTESLSLASFWDIIADKAYTIGRRAVWRDYVDMYFVIKKQFVHLSKITSLAKKKFKGSFNESLFWKIK